MTTIFCKGVTQKNVCCTNEAFKDGICKMHHKKTYDECSICMDDMHVKEKLACGHVFCRNCIYKWKGNTCPMCRSVMFFINHNKNELLDIVETCIKRIDERIKAKVIDEDNLHQIIQLLVENTWIYAYDKSYLDILFEYVTYGLQMNPKGFKKKQKILQAIVLKLSK